jgi:transposase-like protein
MGRKCSICAHESRKKIDKALVAPDANLSGISRIFGVSDDALRNHLKGGHVDAKITKAIKAQEVLEADDLLQELQDIQGHQKTIYEEARARELKIKLEDRTVVQTVVPDNKLALEALRDQYRKFENEEGNGPA